MFRYENETCLKDNMKSKSQSQITEPNCENAQNKILERKFYVLAYNILVMGTGLGHLIEW